MSVVANTCYCSTAGVCRMHSLESTSINTTLTPFVPTCVPGVYVGGVRYEADPSTRVDGIESLFAAQLSQLTDDELEWRFQQEEAAAMASMVRARRTEAEIHRRRGER